MIADVDNILSLPAGRELDALVAEEVMGLSPISRNWPCGYTPDVGDYEAALDQDKPYPWHRDRGPIYQDRNGYARAVEFYSTSIAAAWEVVEKLLLDYPSFRVSARISGQSSGQRKHLWIAGEDDDRSDWCVTADTATLAIVRAALKAVGYGVGP